MTTQRAHLPAVRLGAGELAEPLLMAAVAGSLAAFLCWAGPPGTDFAAHAYQRTVFIDHGFQLWNNLWYAGHYSFITYSLLYYPLAAVFGIKLLAVATVALGTFAFTTVLRHEWGLAARWSSAAFAIVWGAFVLTAAFPFALGVTLALLAVSALQHGSRGPFVLWAVLTLAASPLAFLMLALLLGGVALSGRNDARRLLMPALTVAGLCAIEVLLWRLFPSDGRYPFSLDDLALGLGYCSAVMALTWRIERARILRFIFLAYAIACVGAYLVPSTLGGNIERFEYLTVPITVLVLSLRHWRPLFATVLLLPFAVWWNVSPLADSLRSGISDAGNQQSYWEPAVRFLKTHLTHSYRVEVVGTARHWEAVYLPDSGIPLTRGWFRQDDFPQNEALYDHLSSTRYLRWLRSLGVRYVVLTDSKPDYSAKSEVALLQSGSSGLRPVVRSASLTVFSVPAPRRIVTGPAPARVLKLSEGGLVVRIEAAGSYRVAVRYSPYWHASTGCVAPRADGMTTLRTSGPGIVSLDFSVNADRALSVLGGGSGSTCASSTRLG
ncbi:MAG: hypothetical protein C5B48_12640 [Candidatus Rokuibacteriota bacterium]|nr:MAG: hypothetical protein C5B48_12640 [Candidatus Rokubacteria bacterium]